VSPCARNEKVRSKKAVEAPCGQVSAPQLLGRDVLSGFLPRACACRPDDADVRLASAQHSSLAESGTKTQGV
jgi:hypothetical protein